MKKPWQKGWIPPVRKQAIPPGKDVAGFKKYVEGGVTVYENRGLLIVGSVVIGWTVGSMDWGFGYGELSLFGSDEPRPQLDKSKASVRFPSLDAAVTYARIELLSNPEDYMFPWTHPGSGSFTIRSPARQTGKSALLAAAYAQGAAALTAYCRADVDATTAIMDELRSAL